MRIFKKGIMTALAVAALSFAGAAQAAKVGNPAPDFTGTGSNLKQYKLSDLRGKFVVLEWHNQNCPFVVSQYKGKMQKLQAKWTGKGVLWFTVISSAPKKEGYVQAPQATEDLQKTGAHVTAALLDPKGRIGRAYGAKTTPHMFVIDPKGILIYDGAIDNAPRVDEEITKAESGETYVNYVDRALTEAMEKKKKVSIPSTPPYGCHVKYN